MSDERFGDVTSSVGRVNVLMIDDDPDDYYLISHSIEEHAKKTCNFIYSADLDNAKAIFDQEDIQVILLDLNLQASRGIETLKAALSLFFDTPIVVLTGIDSEELGIELIKRGAADYLSKLEASGTLLLRAILYAVERAQLMNEIKRQAERDPLTGLLNRKGLFERLSFLIEQGKRNSATIALVLFDVDNFKSVNDTYGHDVGDEIIRSVADEMKRGLRKSDLAARFGGDELILVLTNYTDLPQLLDKKIQSLCRDYRVHDQDDGAFHLNISISMGAVEWVEGATIRDLLKVADNAMYDSKGRGKGCYTIGTLSPGASSYERVDS